jgi:hypothetical protein
MDCDKVYAILTEQEGTVAGINLGDSWSEVERMMKSKHETVVADYSAVLGTLTIDYGLPQRRFVINCNLKNDIVQSIDIEVIDLLENKEKLIALHDRLAEHFTEEYPAEFELLPGDFGDYGQWMVMEGEENLTISEPTLIGKASGAIKCTNIDIGLHKRF